MHRLAAREVNHHGRFRRALRRLAACGCQTADGIPTPVVPGRGGHRTMRGPRPQCRTTLRLGTRDGREGTARTAARDALPGELRRTRPTAQRAEGPAVGGWPFTGVVLMLPGVYDRSP